jgi:hypothetical protein
MILPFLPRHDPYSQGQVVLVSIIVGGRGKHLCRHLQGKGSTPFSRKELDPSASQSMEMEPTELPGATVRVVYL